jgi:CRISPR-associated protein Csh2
MQTTLGTQFKLKEGHYVHHFSINPRNLEEMNRATGSNGVTTEDVDKLKEALKNGVTFYDSAAKAGAENELLFWVQLKEGSKLVLPSFVELVSVADDESRTIDFAKVTALLDKETVKQEVEKMEVFYNSATTSVINLPQAVLVGELN